MTPEDIIAAARQSLRTPFRHQGRVPGLALDCAGLFVCTCRAVDLPVEDEQGYGRTPFQGLLLEAIRRQPFLQEVPKADLQPSDVLLMRFTREPQHIAIATDAGMIHAYEHSGAVVEHRLADVWRSRITHVFRFEGLE
ncbi:NlpC/P60 family protein [Pseudomonas sp. JS3066]|uniref:NlpC/P60 family protein n=1 Tax=Pseudomonas sp. JS3066 TaxID=3090665 RepID=UPI002E7C5339|nr:NlpC/P60 family protein [Pseudomonas sp. JS3066]WVK96240.1 NlpC/P60 family protein [Pseudomonas sp. JS3066]